MTLEDTQQKITILAVAYIAFAETTTLAEAACRFAFIANLFMTHPVDAYKYHHEERFIGVNLWATCISAWKWDDATSSSIETGSFLFKDAQSGHLAQLVDWPAGVITVRTDTEVMDMLQLVIEQGLLPIGYHDIVHLF
jgi:hypothetical protein